MLNGGALYLQKRAYISLNKQGLLSKLMDSYAKPWKIITKLKNSSYQLKHRDTKAIDKRHALYLLPYPVKLFPFLPVDDPDNQDGKIHTPIRKNSYINM